MQRVAIAVGDDLNWATITIPVGRQWTEAEAYSVHEQLEALYHGDEPLPDEAACAELITADGE